MTRPSAPANSPCVHPGCCASWRSSLRICHHLRRRTIVRHNLLAGLLQFKFDVVQSAAGIGVSRAGAMEETYPSSARRGSRDSAACRLCGLCLLLGRTAGNGGAGCSGRLAVGAGLVVVLLEPHLDCAVGMCCASVSGRVCSDSLGRCRG